LIECPAKRSKEAEAFLASAFSSARFELDYWLFDIGRHWPL
jgi:hypothetical protein